MRTMTSPLREDSRTFADAQTGVEKQQRNRAIAH